jgi:DNA polymerase elongation subunit (family B)
MRKLILDIETAPNTAYVWKLFKETIPLARLRETGYVMCWSAKWYGKSGLEFGSVFHSNKVQMLRRVHQLLSEADCVIHFNGKSFDVPHLNREFLLQGWAPPAPYKQVDILQVVRSTFNFTSNKLDHIAHELGVGKKIRTDFELWVDCMNGDPGAWKHMERYNKMDVRVLERVYRRVLPWINVHPNHGLFAGKPVCTNCGSSKVQSRGPARSMARIYHRYQCLGCGKWMRGESYKQPNVLRSLAA